MKNLEALGDSGFWAGGSAADTEAGAAYVAHIREAVQVACARLAPLWPLRQFVAVNPFLGVLDKPFHEVCEWLRKLGQGDILMDAAFYQEQLDSGRIANQDLQQAISLLAWETDLTLCKRHLGSLVAGHSETAKYPAIVTLAEKLDIHQGSQWAVFVVEEVAKWCAAYFDDGQSAWRMPWRHLPLFQAWKQAALVDLNPEVAGLNGFRRTVASLPDQPEMAIAEMLSSLGLAEAQLGDFLHKQLLSVRGWGGYVQYRVREAHFQGQADDSMLHLLAIRLAYDYALRRGFSHIDWNWPDEPSGTQSDLRLLGLFQLAYELGWQRRLLDKLGTAPTVGTESAKRPALQAVFCIDVRSEVYRRALETVIQEAETLGFAGFFGFPIEFVPFGKQHGTALCPVLLTPQFRIRETVAGAESSELRSVKAKRWTYQRMNKSWKAFKTSAVSCFGYVEVAGLAFGVKLLTDSLGWTRTVAKPATEGLVTSVNSRLQPVITPSTGRLAAGIAPQERVALAKNALAGMGLTKDFARLVLLCGHGASTVNNPYAAGLDCGACGGHSGETNARVAAAVLNDANVRQALVGQGINIPADTWFIAGLHDTTTDELRLFDLVNLPESHTADLVWLQNGLAQASELARLERATGLGLKVQNPAQLARAVTDRSRDWAQVRPEWGLAGNAAFIAAPRERTRHVKLDGRVFLHSYDHSQDPDGKILALIMTAPLVVASWINLQYYASTVNNLMYGSGNKVIHNVVGTLGVVQGNGGDLQTGLPWQSLHDGQNLRHEPLRLSVYLEAPQLAIERVIRQHESVAQLVDNQWVHLFSLESCGGRCHRYLGLGEWQLEN